MNRFVTFCIKIGIALLVLAVISNTTYADTTTENANGNPTMAHGTISGSYTDTWSDNLATQDLLEAKVSGKYYLDCNYDLSTAIKESRISAFEIGVNAWYTSQGTDSFTVYVWDYGTSSWDSTTITITATSHGATLTDTTTMGTEHIRDSDGNIAIRFDNNTADNRQATLKIDYLYVKLTYTTILSVNTDKGEYCVGETITVSWTTADCCGSGESYINIDYRDASDDTQWCLHSTSTAATSDVSCPIPSSCAGHMIDIYVYTASTDAASYTAAITEGAPWPKSTYSPVTPEFLIIAIPLLSAVAIYFLMRRSKKKGSKII